MRAICVYQHSVGSTVWRWLPHGEMSAKRRSLTRIVEADVEVREDVLSPPSMGTARPSVFADEVDLRVVSGLHAALDPEHLADGVLIAVVDLKLSICIHISRQDRISSDFKKNIDFIDFQTK